MEKQQGFPPLILEIYFYSDFNLFFYQYISHLLEIFNLCVCVNDIFVHIHT